MACGNCQNPTEEEIGFVGALLAAIPTVISAGKTISGLISGGNRSNRRVKAAVDPNARSQQAQSTGLASPNALVRWQGKTVTVNWLTNELRNQSNLITRTNKSLRKVNKRLSKVVRSNRNLTKSVKTRTWIGAGSTVLALLFGIVGGRFSVKKAAK